MNAAVIKVRHYVLTGVDVCHKLTINSGAQQGNQCEVSKRKESEEV